MKARDNRDFGGSPGRLSHPASGIDAPSAVGKRWNTKNLSYRLAVDAASASSAAALISPVICIIDKSVMENASGRASIGDSLWVSFRTLVLRPQALLASRPFALMFMLYGGTYLTANALDTASSTLHDRPATAVTAGTAKFAASSTTNVSLSIYKDQAFARMFGPPGGVAAARAVPLVSYALFGARDCLTIFASFNVPPLLGPWLADRLPEGIQSHVTGQTLAQFTAPAAVQLVSTPVHLLGLDLYNRPWDGAARRPSWADRWRQVRGNWAVSAAARMCRVIPAFGVGGVVNSKMRSDLMEKLV